MSEESPRPRALVAGGSGGIGGAICRVLARDGWDIVLTYYTDKAAAEQTADRVRRAGGGAEIHQIDLRDIAAAGDLVTGLGEERPLDGIVYAAGPYVPQLFIGKLSPQQFSDSLDADTKAFYNIVQPALSQLRATKGSVVSVVTPVIDRYAPRDVLSSAPKAAIQSIIKGIALEEGRFGVRANAVGVGVIEGEGMWTELRASGDFSDAMIAAAKANTALRSFGNVDDIAEAASFLMSDRARWITGQTLNVDGGYSI